jgi:peptidoglycan-N-acetylglucosamine deacetylase
MRGMVVEALGLSLGAAGFLAYGVRGRSARVFGPSVYHGPRDRPAIALTFDDGPSESTPQLLELLARHGVKATFFQCGASVRRLPEVARAVAVAGHDIGNHAYSHSRLYLQMPAFVAGEITHAQETIQEVTGVTPHLFRAPFGGRWFGLRRVQKRLGLMGVMWTRMGWDWVWPAGRVADHLLGGAENGAIFCMHDGRETQPSPDIRNTIEAVERLLEELPARGFHFETVSRWFPTGERRGSV